VGYAFFFCVSEKNEWGSSSFSLCTDQQFLKNNNLPQQCLYILILLAFWLFTNKTKNRAVMFYKCSEKKPADQKMKSTFEPTF
jgi:hypothetical protein